MASSSVRLSVLSSNLRSSYGLPYDSAARVDGCCGAEKEEAEEAEEKEEEEAGARL